MKINNLKSLPYLIEAFKDRDPKVRKEAIEAVLNFGSQAESLLLEAKNSKNSFTAIGILISSPDKDNLKKNLRQAGAEYIVDDFIQLIRLLETGKL